jgi:hypothetical protein
MLSNPKYEEYRKLIIREMRDRVVNEQSLLDSDIVRNECHYVCKRMSSEFRELRMVGGFYLPTDAPDHTLTDPENDGMYNFEHWWLTNSDNEIIDPTREQFHYEGRYVELDRSIHRVRLGACINCGFSIFGLISEGSKSVCSDECAKSLEEIY